MDSPTQLLNNWGLMLILTIHQTCLKMHSLTFDSENKKCDRFLPLWKYYHIIVNTSIPVRFNANNAAVGGIMNY